MYAGMKRVAAARGTPAALQSASTSSTAVETSAGTSAALPSEVWKWVWIVARTNWPRYASSCRRYDGWNCRSRHASPTASGVPSSAYSWPDAPPVEGLRRQSVPKCGSYCSRPT